MYQSGQEFFGRFEIDTQLFREEFSPDFAMRTEADQHFELLQIGPIVCQSLHKQREEAIVDVNVHEDFLATD